MMPVTIKRSGKTNQFIVELRDGLDTIRCAVHMEGAAGKAASHLDPGAKIYALARAKKLARALLNDEDAP